MRNLVIVAVLVAAVAAGWWWLSGRAPGTSIGGDGGAPLAFVPADTPYVFATLEPMPSDVVDAWMEQGESLTSLWQVQLAQGIRALERDRPEADELKWMRALRTELADRTLREAFVVNGFDLRGEFALYGIGVVPVLRMTLADPDKFRGLIARLEAAVGEPFPSARLDDQDYWQMLSPKAGLRGVMALQGRHLVLTVAPSANDDALRVLLGLERPANDMRDGGALARLNTQFDYLPYLSGFIDTTRIAALMSAPATPLESAFLDAAGVEKPVPDPVCASEYAAVAAQFPRISGGYTALEAKHMRMVSRLETNSAIAADLMKLRAPMPGLQQVSSAPLNFGLSLKLAQLPPLASAWASAAAASPWQCPQLLWLNEGFASARDQLSNPMVFGTAPVFSGLHAIATRLEFSSLDQAPEMSGKLLIGSPNPAALVGMAKSFVPPLASIQLSADGQVQRLPALPNVPTDLPAFVAMTDHVLGLALGEKEDADLLQYMESDPAQQPLLVFGYSGALLAQFNRTVLDATAVDGAGAELAAQRDAIDAVTQLYARIRRAELRVEFEETGVVMVQSADLD